MTKADDPAELPTTEDRLDCWCGKNKLTKREWLAGKALEGLCSNASIMEGMAQAGGKDLALVSKGIAIMAKAHADAMIVELNKPTEAK